MGVVLRIVQPEICVQLLLVPGGNLRLGQARILPTAGAKPQAGPLQMGVEIRHKAGVEVLPQKLQRHIEIGGHYFPPKIWGRA